MKNAQLKLLRLSVEPLNTANSYLNSEPGASQPKRENIANPFRISALALVKQKTGFHRADSQVYFDKESDTRNYWPVSRDLVNLAKEYCLDVGKRGFIVADIEAKIVFRLPYVTRFHQQYAKKRTLKLMEDLKNVKTAGFLTLTKPPNDVSPYEHYRNLEKDWNEFITLARRAWKKGELSNRFVNHQRMRVFEGWTGEFVKVVEVHANGSAHLHVILPGCTFFDTDWIDTHWKGRYVFEPPKYAKKQSDCVKYAIKYLDTAVKWCGQSPDFNSSVLWSLGARAYSRGLVRGNKTIPTRTKRNFVFLGIDYDNSKSTFSYISIDGVDYVRDG